jgi:hypothetical protein
VNLTKVPVNRLAVHSLVFPWWYLKWNTLGRMEVKLVAVLHVTFEMLGRDRPRLYWMAPMCSKCPISILCFVSDRKLTETGFSCRRERERERERLSYATGFPYEV